jgi:hypothetical protein
MRFRVTLMQNLPNRQPSAMSAKYSYSDGRTATWPVQAIGPDRDVAVVVVECVVDLVHQAGVLSRELIAHYPLEPSAIPIAISSVQRVVAA